MNLLGFEIYFIEFPEVYLSVPVSVCVYIAFFLLSLWFCFLFLRRARGMCLYKLCMSRFRVLCISLLLKHSRLFLQNLFFWSIKCGSLFGSSIILYIIIIIYVCIYSFICLFMFFLWKLTMWTDKNNLQKFLYCYI